MQPPPTPLACPPRQRLQAYLSGWTTEQQAAEIEQHISDCAACEQSLRELETTPDSLLQSLRADTSAARDTPPGEDLGAYELLRPLARGGMGAVYVARHRQLDRNVAIKLLPAPSAENPEALARFRREVRAAGRLKHPAIVAATDAGAQQGTHYLVMELVEGLDLSRLAQQVRELPLADACELARQTALGLSYAHAQGIVHRDIKPSNLMLDRSGQVKILDFGLAQLSFWDEASVELTTVGQLMGTLDYMAPEQAQRSGAVDYRADLYALGATLFRLLCGRAPLAATPHQSPLEKLQLLARHEAPQLQTLRRDAPPELADLVAELLARQPEDRPASAAHVAERLTAFTAGADLHGLLARAQVAAEAEPIGNRRVEQPAPWREPALANAGVSNRSGGRGRQRLWLAAAAVPLFLLAGVLILLETQKGQLVIDSEVAGVRVQLLQDGQPVRKLEIQPGATATRLRADRYEIVIDSPSDAVVVDKDWFELRSGESVVARIQQRPAGTAAEVATADPAQAIAASPAADEPLYDGKPLSHWLETLQRDRSPESIGQALVAIEAMVSPSTAQRITEVMFELLPKLNGQLLIPYRKDRISSVDRLGFQILEKANPGQALIAQVSDALERADAAWSERLLNNLDASQAPTLEAAEPLIRVLEQHVFASTSEASPTVVKAAQWFIRNLLVQLHTTEREERRQSSVKRLLGILESSPHVSLTDFWLVNPINSQWPLELRQAVLKRAADTLADSSAPASLVAQAAIILADDAKLALQLAPELPVNINVRLSNLTLQPQRMLDRVEVSRSFHETKPRLLLPGGGNLVTTPPRSRRGNILNTSMFINETLAILGLADSLPNDVDLAAGLQAIHEATAAPSKALEIRVTAIPASDRAKIELEWPSLQVVRVARGVFEEMPDNEVAKLRDLLPPSELMHYAIHAAANEILSKRTKNDQPAAQP